MFKLKVVDGKVNTLLKTGNDFVRTSLSEETANSVLKGAKVSEGIEGYPICVNDEWFFEVEETEEQAPKAEAKPKKKGKK